LVNKLKEINQIIEGLPSLNSSKDDQVTGGTGGFQDELLIGRVDKKG
jgi:hypothetical protein